MKDININIKNKNILFIGPKFHQYHTEIIKVIESNGASVSFYAEDIYFPLYRIMCRLVPKISKKIRFNYANSILKNIKSDEYDIVFVIRGGILFSRELEIMKKKLSNAKFVMYQWDSMKQSQYQSIIKYFDVVKTVDQNDAKKYNLEYLTLFCTRDYIEVGLIKKEKLYKLNHWLIT